MNLASSGAQKVLLSLEQSVAWEAATNKIREAQGAKLKWKALRARKRG